MVQQSEIGSSFHTAINAPDVVRERKLIRSSLIDAAGDQFSDISARASSIVQTHSIPGQEILLFATQKPPIEEASFSEVPFPQEIEARKQAIYPAINVASETSFLLLLQPHVTHLWDLRKRYRETLKGSSMEDLHKSFLTNYGITLESIGLLTKAHTVNEFGKDVVIGFGLNDAGMRYGRPIFWKVLSYEAEHGSLRPILGSTFSPDEDSRAPYTRQKILYALREGGMSKAQLRKSFGIDDTVLYFALESLEKLGLIDADSLVPEEAADRITFTRSGDLTPEDIKAIQQTGYFSYMIADICRIFTEQGMTISYRNLLHALPHSELEVDVLHRKILSSVSTLEQKGFLRRDVIWRSGNQSDYIVKSWYTLTEDGEKLVDELIVPINDALADGPWLQKLTEELGSLTYETPEMQDCMHKAVENYFPYSQKYHLQQYPTRLIEIELMAQKAGSHGLTYKDLTSKYGFHEVTARNYLNKLAQTGKVKVERRGKMNHYIAL